MFLLSDDAADAEWNLKKVVALRQDVSRAEALKESPRDSACLLLHTDNPPEGHKQSRAIATQTFTIQLLSLMLIRGKKDVWIQMLDLEVTKTEIRGWPTSGALCGYTNALWVSLLQVFSSLIKLFSISFIISSQR